MQVAHGRHQANTLAILSGTRESCAQLSNSVQGIHWD
jgi:hypothetical protein